MAKITLDDISKTLNISKNTASKALRGAPGVSEDLRKKIIQVASEMGYKKSVQSTDSDLRDITVIGRKTFFAEVTFWPHVLFGITHYASENKIKISIINIDETKEDKPDILSSIINHQSDGYIIVGTISDSLLKKIKATNLPTIVVDHFSEEIDCDYINSSNKIGLYKTIRHLYQNNHRNIGFIGNSISAYSFAERYEAYLKYMKEFSLDIHNDFIWLDAEYLNTEYYKKKFSQLRHSTNFPTAFVCVNDSTALTFMNALAEMEIKVPDDISVVGFDNISELSYPGLTTIEVPKQVMGERAVEQLLYRIKNPNAPCSNIILNTQLIQRNSVKTINRNKE